MKWIILEDEKVVANAIAEIMIDVLSKNPQSVLGLATGNTMIVPYQSLVAAYREGRIHFSEATSFNLDEYLGIGRDHPASFHRFMEEHLFSETDFNPEHTHLPGCEERKTCKEQCEAYEKAIRTAGGIDLLLLGIGRNGHIGFNEPASTLEVATHVTTLTASTKKVNAGAFENERMPDQAITMGMGTILRARRILLVATGPQKVEILEALKTSALDPWLPASFLHLHPDVTVLIDREASGEISKK